VSKGNRERKETKQENPKSAPAASPFPQFGRSPAHPSGPEELGRFQVAHLPQCDANRSLGYDLAHLGHTASYFDACPSIATTGMESFL
jgi:hypothetical protein